MAWFTKARLKYALAGAGAVYIVLVAGYFIYGAVVPDIPTGPSELEAHPERQAEILARRRAEELRDQLQLTEEQTRQIADIYFRYPDGMGGDEAAREQRKTMRGEIAKVLTPEQLARLEQIRSESGGPGRPQGPGGAAGQITPERVENLKEVMTPEQRERFEKAAQQMKPGHGDRDGKRGGVHRIPQGKGAGKKQKPPEQ